MPSVSDSPSGPDLKNENWLLRTRIDKLEASLKTEENAVLVANQRVESLERSNAEYVQKNLNLLTATLTHDRQIANMDKEMQRLKEENADKSEKLRLAENTRLDALKKKSEHDVHIKNLMVAHLAELNRSDSLKATVEQFVDKFKFLQEEVQNKQERINEHDKQRRMITETEELQRDLNSTIDKLNDDIIMLTNQCNQQNDTLQAQQKELEELRPPKLPDSPIIPAREARVSHGSMGSVLERPNLEDELQQDEVFAGEAEIAEPAAVQVVSQGTMTIEMPKRDFKSIGSQTIEIPKREFKSIGSQTLEMPKRDFKSIGSQTRGLSPLDMLKYWFRGLALQQQFKVFLLVTLLLYLVIDYLALLRQRSAWRDANDFAFLAAPSPFGMLQMIGGDSMASIGFTIEESLGVRRSAFG